ncbi:hypothetical protein Hdeb2414_s0020g00554621 [Helianthus debilis subsp. tardiflorus]
MVMLSGQIWVADPSRFGSRLWFTFSVHAWSAVADIRFSQQVNGSGQLLCDTV